MQADNKKAGQRLTVHTGEYSSSEALAASTSRSELSRQPGWFTNATTKNAVTNQQSLKLWKVLR